MKKLLVIAVLPIVLSGCKKERTTNDVLPVTQYYNVYYNITADITEFKATFSHPTSETILPSGYSITVNDSSMQRLAYTGPAIGPSYYYSRVDSGNIGAYFKLRRADGTILNNIIANNTVDPINFNATYSTITISDTLSVAFTSDSLNTGEAITVTITQDATHYTFQQVPVQSGDTSVVLLPVHMSNLIPGPATLKLSRSSAVLSLLNADGTGVGNMRATVFAEQQVTIQL
jgi:hypothetical protein